MAECKRFYCVNEACRFEGTLSVKMWVESGGDPRCPLCAAPMTDKDPEAPKAAKPKEVSRVDKASGGNSVSGGKPKVAGQKRRRKAEG